MITARLRPAQFQPVQRRLARQRRAVSALRREFASKDRQHGIVPKFVMVVAVFIFKRDADYPLQHRRADFVPTNSDIRVSLKHAANRSVSWMARSVSPTARHQHPK